MRVECADVQEQHAEDLAAVECLRETAKERQVLVRGVQVAGLQVGDAWLIVRGDAAGIRRVPEVVFKVHRHLSDAISVLGKIGSYRVAFVECVAFVGIGIGKTSASPHQPSVP